MVKGLERTIDNVKKAIGGRIRKAGNTIRAGAFYLALGATGVGALALPGCGGGGSSGGSSAGNTNTNQTTQEQTLSETQKEQNIFSKFPDAQEMTVNVDGHSVTGLVTTLQNGAKVLFYNPNGFSASSNIEIFSADDVQKFNQGPVGDVTYIVDLRGSITQSTFDAIINTNSVSDLPRLEARADAGSFEAGMPGSTDAKLIVDADNPEYVTCECEIDGKTQGPVADITLSNNGYGEFSLGDIPNLGLGADQYTADCTFSMPDLDNEYRAVGEPTLESIVKNAFSFTITPLNNEAPKITGLSLTTLDNGTLQMLNGKVAASQTAKITVSGVTDREDDANGLEVATEYVVKVDGDATWTKLESDELELSNYAGKKIAYGVQATDSNGDTTTESKTITIADQPQIEMYGADGQAIIYTQDGVIRDVTGTVVISSDDIFALYGANDNYEVTANWYLKGSRMKNPLSLDEYLEGQFNLISWGDNTVVVEYNIKNKLTGDIITVPAQYKIDKNYAAQFDENNKGSFVEGAEYECTDGSCNFPTLQAPMYYDNNGDDVDVYFYRDGKEVGLGDEYTPSYLGPGTYRFYAVPFDEYNAKGDQSSIYTVIVRPRPSTGGGSTGGGSTGGGSTGGGDTGGGDTGGGTTPGPGGGEF